MPAYSADPHPQARASWWPLTDAGNRRCTTATASSSSRLIA